MLLKKGYMHLVFNVHLLQDRTTIGLDKGSILFLIYVCDLFVSLQVLSIIKAWSCRMNQQHHTWVVLSAGSQRSQILEAVKAWSGATMASVEERHNVVDGLLHTAILVLEFGTNVPKVRSWRVKCS